MPNDSNPLTIGFLCPSLSRTAGGIFEIVRQLSKALSVSCNIRLRVYGAQDQFSSLDRVLWDPIITECHPYSGPAQFRYSSALRDAVLAQRFDLLHGHALWLHTSLITRQWAKRHRAPYMVTINGMLEPWAIQNSRLKKHLAWLLYERTILQHAACLQVNSHAEAISVRNLGLRTPICVIPNGIDLPGKAVTPDLNPRQAAWNIAADDNSRVILYLGRIHPKKGLSNLIRAWAALTAMGSANHWLLAIVGWDQYNHLAELQDLVRIHGVSHSIRFFGARYGHLKEMSLQTADAFILPSYSEGFPMAVLEAWSYGKPVLMTDECNIPRGFDVDAAVRVEPNVSSLTAGLAKLLAMSDEARDSMGTRGLRLVADEYNWTAIATQMESVYRWILRKDIKPHCVID
jgi:glycosyltransferase involved in cell wall biosynthesis